MMRFSCSTCGWADGMALAAARPEWRRLLLHGRERQRSEKAKRRISILCFPFDPCFWLSSVSPLYLGIWTHLKPEVEKVEQPLVALEDVALGRSAARGRSQRHGERVKEGSTMNRSFPLPLPCLAGERKKEPLLGRCRSWLACARRWATQGGRTRAAEAPAGEMARQARSLKFAADWDNRYR